MVAGAAVIVVVDACAWRLPFWSYLIRLIGWPIRLDDCEKYERADVFMPPTAVNATRQNPPMKNILMVTVNWNIFRLLLRVD